MRVWRGEEGFKSGGGVGGGGQWGEALVGVVGFVEEGEVRGFAGFDEVDGSGDFGWVHDLVDLGGVEGGDGGCCAGVGVVGGGYV